VRGIAALFVVVQHFCEGVYPAFGRFSINTFRVGEFGVLLFFLCSGFVIPSSLERRASLRAFWIGRAFRLFPVYWFAISSILILHVAGYYRGPDHRYLASWVGNSLLNMTMLQRFFDGPLLMGQSWTLAFEMTFYVALSVLFVVGAHRHSTRYTAMLLGIAAIVGAHVAGNVLRRPGWTLLAGVGVAGALLAVSRSSRGQGGSRRAMAVIGTAAVAVLLLYPDQNTFETGLYFGTMFAGTAIYRWTTGEVNGRTLGLLALFAAAALTAGQLHRTDLSWDFSAHDWAELLTYLSAYVVFFLAVVARRRRFPRALTFLGTISYSIYLNHSIVLFAGPRWPAHRTTTLLVGVALTIAGSALTYRLIERPSIALGRKQISRSAKRRLDLRVGRPRSEQQPKQYPGLVRVEQPGADQAAPGQVGFRTDEAVGAA
jgi:peptidoglycan/LPS O-acetylase OafA/YrhL